MPWWNGLEESRSGEEVSGRVGQARHSSYCFYYRNGWPANSHRQTEMDRCFSHNWSTVCIYIYAYNCRTMHGIVLFPNSGLTNLKEKNMGNQLSTNKIHAIWRSLCTMYVSLWEKKQKFDVLVSSGLPQRILLESIYSTFMSCMH